jgi:hypothetical protein
MPRDRTSIRAGMTFTGAAHPVAVGPYAKRADIGVGTFMTSTPVMTKQGFVPAEQTSAVTAAEIGARLDALQVKLANVVAQLHGGK